MILHLVTDEKFTDYAIRQFAAVEHTSVFVMVLRPEQVNLHYVNNKSLLQLLPYNSEKYLQLINTLGNYSAIITHGLFEKWQQELILQAPCSVKIAWVFWGGEIYGQPKLHKRFLSTSSLFLWNCKCFLYNIKGKQQNLSANIPDVVFQRIDYCLSDETEEFLFAKQYIGKPIQYLWYNYYSIEETVGVLQNANVEGNNIIIGNSCTFENNHLMAMRLLRAFKLKDRQIIVPLSYGESWLRSRILYIGKILFGNKIKPVVDIMPLSAYNLLLQSCSIAIMPHYRPQAFGNILTLLWLGTKVYISKKNMAYTYMKRIGLIICSIEDELNKKNKIAIVPLSSNEIMHNRTILLREYGKANMQKRIELIVKELNQ